MATAPTSISIEEGVTSMLSIDRSTRGKIGWGIFAVVAATYVVTQHLEHLPTALPYLFLLACPLMHIFMHHGHGHGGHQHGAPGPSDLATSEKAKGHAIR
jgi:hypothetical protein